jgi:hypothetical protein
MSRIAIKRLTVGNIYQTHLNTKSLLISHASPFSTTLLIRPFHHTFRLAILLLIHGHRLSILLLVEIIEGTLLRLSAVSPTVPAPVFTFRPTATLSKNCTHYGALNSTF